MSRWTKMLNTPSRKNLSISQRDLAYWLGVSPSLLSLYEDKQRTLPSAALIKISLLEIALDQHKKASPAKLKASTEKAQVQTAFAIKSTSAAKKRLSLVKTWEYQAAALPLQITQLEHCLQVLRNLQSGFPIGKATKLDRDWLEWQEKKVIKRLKTAIETEIKLRLKIAVARATAEVHETFFK